jgi:pimeloyl-ACP methyl ester carboxylesterase
MPTASGIYYAEFDEGRKEDPPIVLIHGAGSSHQVWPAEIRRLPGQRVLAVDLPGHGRSAGIARQTIRAYADRIVDFLGELGLYHAVFIGHAMGGAIALALAVRDPMQVAGLGLISTGAYLGVDPGFLEDLSNPVTIPSALHRFQKRAFGPDTPLPLIERCMAAIKETRGSVLYGDWRACADFDLRDAVAQIEAPTWVIVGSEDQVTPVAYAHFLVGRMPAARLQIIPGGGHMVMLEQTGRVAQGLQQYLSALSAARFAAARVRLPNPSTAIPYQTEKRKR